MLEDLPKGKPLARDHPILQTPLPTLLGDAFHRFADRECVVCDGRRYSYAEVDAACARIANRLIAAGIGPGDHAAVYSRNCVEAFLATLGIIRAGAVWIPVNPLNPVAGNVELLLRFEVQALFYQQVFREVADAVEQGLPGCKTLVPLDRGSDDRRAALSRWSAQASPMAPEPDLQPDDLISIPMTGGTTGAPKGVMLTQRNFAAISYGMCESFVGRGEQVVMLCAAPMSHVSGRFAVTTLPAGARYVIMDGVDLQKILHSIVDEGITDLFLPPTAIYRLLAQPNLRGFDFSSLRCFFYGAAPMAVGKLREALAVFGPVMRGAYGQSECSSLITALWQQEHYVDGEVADDERLSSVGRATVVSEVAIVDDQGQPRPRGEVGEIAVKSPIVFAGYWNDPDATRAQHCNGWHLTDDIGRFDAQGYLHIVDRKKDMIISGGFNVYSAEVEQALAELPGVALAAVIGVPSEQWGEEVKALVQRTPGSGIGADAIRRHCRRLLGPVKTPKTVDFVDELPRTAVGKIDKKALRAPYWAGAGRNV